MHVDRFTPDPHEPSAKPYAMVGAGKLTSTIWKTENSEAGWRYRFNFFRVAANGRVGQKFRPLDLVKLIRLVRLLAIAGRSLALPYRHRNCSPPNDLHRLLRFLANVGDFPFLPGLLCLIHSDSPA